MCDYFRDYLYYASNFTVYTDCNPLTYVLTTAKLSATGHRWVSELADFHFSIKYMPGNKNQVADTLSRMPISRIRQECTEETSLDTVDAIMHGVKVVSSKDCILVNSWKIHSKAELPDQKFNPENLPNSISRSILIQAQEDDPVIGLIRQSVLDGVKSPPDVVAKESPAVNSKSGLMEFWFVNPITICLYKLLFLKSFDHLFYENYTTK